MTKTITINMSAEDFSYLYDTSMNWNSVDWQVQDGRFDPMPDYRKFVRAYWFNSYSSLLLARSFVAAEGFEYSVHFDEAEDSGWVLLTDFGGKL